MTQWWFRQQTEALRYGSREAVLALLKEEGMALQYAREEHRRDKAIAAAAVEQNQKATQFALPEDNPVNPAG